MTLDKIEAEKVLYYILTNKKICLSNNGLFNRDNIILLINTLKNKKNDVFKLTEKQKDAIISSFLKGNGIFDEYTPNILLNNSSCKNVAIERNINSVDYIKDFTPELINKAIKLALKNNYILNDNSPSFLKGNFDVALNSIKLNSISADHVDWDNFSLDQLSVLIKETIKSGYILSNGSCYTLKNNPDIVINSINKKEDTMKYTGDEAKNNPAVFKYLLLNGYEYEFTKTVLRKMPLICYADFDVMKYAINKFNLIDKDCSNYHRELESKFNDIEIEKYEDRYTELLVTSLKNIPTIDTFKDVFKYVALCNWDNYKEENMNIYANIFGKICAELREIEDFDCVCDNLVFLDLMKETLGNKYNTLLCAMKEYHRIIHNNLGLNNIDASRDQIANLSSLYISKEKEKYVKNEINDFLNYIKKFFIPKKDNPKINKKINTYLQKAMLREMSLYNNEDYLSLVNEIEKQYESIIDKSVISTIIQKFVYFGDSKLYSLKPERYDEYKLYLEAKKLINRLNKHYIKYEDQDLIRFYDIISFDESLKEYVYTGPIFNGSDIMEFEKFNNIEKVFEKIKRQIMSKTKKLEVNTDDYYEILKKIKNDLPFTDEYFEIDKEQLNDFNLNDLIDIFQNEDDIIEPNSLIDDDTYDILKNYFINNGIFWLLLFLNEKSNWLLSEYGINVTNVFSTFNYMSEIKKFVEMFNYNIDKYGDIIRLSTLASGADEQSIAIIGTDVLEKLVKYKEYTNEESVEIVDIARDLICGMAKRSEWTVPFIEGKYGNYEYSMYDSLDETLLLAGINTDACFRVDGNDNDFLHYCALDKNGFVIKITDTYGNFIARASGFRNGNCIFINQLRTISDIGGEGYNGDNSEEQEEIIEVFKKACNDIVKISQNNETEKNKIDFVFVTRSYAFHDTDSNVSQSVEREIGDCPMEMESEDWEKFVNNTKNLQECEEIDDAFSTDYGGYSLICVASSIDIDSIDSDDIKKGDVKPVYKRVRNRVIVTDNIDSNIVAKINKIRGINSYYNEFNFTPTIIPDGSKVFIGDNWYILCNDNKIIESCVLDFDEKALIEYEVTKNELASNLNIEETNKKLSLNQQKNPN